MLPSKRNSEFDRRAPDDFAAGEKLYYDADADLTIAKLFTGDYFVTDKPKHMLLTILGSCVSACIRDPVARVGGMNHFLLPQTSDTETISVSEATRYGAFAMETLINQILKLGGMRSRLEIKLFGGGNVTTSSALIGQKNVEFVRRYLREEGLPIASEDLGGDYPRRIHYYPDTGKVMMRNLRRKDDYKVVDEEKQFAATLRKKPVEGEVDLF